MFDRSLYESRLIKAKKQFVEASKLEKMTKELAPLRSRIAALRSSLKSAKGGDAKQKIHRAISQLTMHARSIRKKYGQIK